jgi:DNA-directed RNA polymerase I, II, and III subunit RPABC2
MSSDEGVSEPEPHEEYTEDFMGRKTHTLANYRGMPLADDEYLEPPLTKSPPPREWTSAVRVTIPHLTKYERARVLGTRAMQISRSAPPLITPSQDDDSALKIAYKEFETGQTPFIIRRYLPDGLFEDWALSELM